MEGKRCIYCLWPCGGAQCTPKSLKFYEKNKAIAAVREMINKSCDYNPIYKRAIRGFDQIYAINGETQAQLERIAKKDVTLLPELALREDFKNVNVEHRKNDIFKIVFVGRLIAKKGVAFMLDVLSKMPNEFDWTVDIIGSGSEKTAIEKQIKELGLINKVFLRGNMPFAEVFRAYESADIFVLPSLRETSGNVLLEAMAYKLPIVALDTSFCTTLKEQGCGIFINTNQSLDKIQQGFVDAIVLLHDDEKLRLQLGENGYCYVNQELTWERKYQKIYLTDYSKCR